MYLGPFTHQSTGLNRVGRYRQPAREKGPLTDGTGEGVKGRRGERRNEPWRRITGIFPHVEMSPRERRAGIARLVAWIENRTTRRVGDAETRGDRGMGGTPVPQNCTAGVPPARVGEADRSAVGAGKMPAVQFSFVHEWEFSAETWARTQHRGTCVEEICFELGISAARLSSLLKEYCGLSASEFVDGLMIRGLKPMLFEKIRAAAFELWGAPGSFVWEKLGSFSVSEFSSPKNVAQAKEVVAGTPSARGGELESRVEFVSPDECGNAEHASVQAVSKVAGRGRPTHQFSGLRSQNGQSHVGRFAKSPGAINSRIRKSRYFRARPQDFFEESRAEERARRLGELCEMLRARRGRTGSQLQTAAARGTLSQFRIADFGLGRRRSMPTVYSIGMLSPCMWDLLQRRD